MERHLSVDPAGVPHTLLRVFSVKVLLFHRKHSEGGVTMVKLAALGYHKYRTILCPIADIN